MKWIIPIYQRYWHTQFLNENKIHQFHLNMPSKEVKGISIQSSLRYFEVNWSMNTEWVLHQFKPISPVPHFLRSIRLSICNFSSADNSSLLERITHRILCIYMVYLDVLMLFLFVLWYCFSFFCHKIPLLICSKHGRNKRFTAFPEHCVIGVPTASFIAGVPKRLRSL
jgi:hypothetical protein